MNKYKTLEFRNCATNGRTTLLCIFGHYVRLPKHLLPLAVNGRTQVMGLRVRTNLFVWEWVQDLNVLLTILSQTVVTSSKTESSQLRTPSKSKRDRAMMSQNWEPGLKKTNLWCSRSTAKYPISSISSKSVRSRWRNVPVTSSRCETAIANFKRACANETWTLRNSARSSKKKTKKWRIWESACEKRNTRSAICPFPVSGRRTWTVIRAKTSAIRLRWSAEGTGVPLAPVWPVSVATSCCAGSKNSSCASRNKAENSKKSDAGGRKKKTKW